MLRSARRRQRNSRLIHHLLAAGFAPFLEFGFMRRALVACLSLALGCGPLGVLLVQRRMSLVGDAMAHAILPGAALGFLVAGLSLWAMGLGGLAAGLLVASLAGFISRSTAQREDASFAALYLISLALGVLLISLHGNAVDLMHMLFGSALAVDNPSLFLLAGIASVTLLFFAFAYRAFLMEAFDPGFLKAQGAPGGLYHGLFLFLVVLNLVGSFQALGTLMAVGLLILPAAAARFLADEVWAQALIATGIGLVSGYAGLLLSYHGNLASGPCIVLTAGVAYFLSVAFGSHGGYLSQRRRRHRVA
jgi:zinc/manganese transport system permease protein